MQRPQLGQRRARRFLWTAALFSMAGVVWFAPALSAADSATRRLRRGDYAGAVALLRPAAARAPRSVQIQRQLGAALFKSGDAAGAVKALRAARDLTPQSRSTQFFLAAAAEASGDSALALDAYRALLAIGGGGLGPVRARVDALLQARVRNAVTRALAVEKQLTLDEIPANTLAVPEFALAAESDSLRPICRGLAVVLLTDLNKVPELRIVERERLPILLQELALAAGATTGPQGERGPVAVDQATAPRLGRLLGARRFAQGSVLPLTAARLELRASVIIVGSGELQPTRAPVEGPLTEVLQLEKRLVYDVLATLGVRVDAALRRAIGVPVTRSFPAFLAYSRGLDFEARGLTAEAATTYREALRLDGRFSLAQERMDVVSATTEAWSGLEQVFLAGDLSEPGGAMDRNERSQDAMGFGPSSGQEVGASGTASVEAPSRLGQRQLEPLPGFPGLPPKRTTSRRVSSR